MFPCLPPLVLKHIALIAGLGLASAGLSFAASPASGVPARSGSGSVQAWPGWRGSNGDNVACPGTYPAKFTEPDSILWKAPLPGKGMSTPIIWERRIYLTAPHAGEDAVLAFDWSGKQLWMTTLGKEKPGRHKNASGSNPTPATDGKHLFVIFKSGTFAALDFQGKVVWSTNLVERFGPDTLFWDYGASPVVAGPNVIVTRMHHGESWLAAFDRATGELRWKVARNFTTPQENDNGYTTPLLVRRGGREQLVVWGGEHVTLHDAADGRVLWTCGGFNVEAIKNWPAVASPVVVGDMVVVPYGRADRSMPQLHGLRIEGEGDRTATARKWYRKNIGTFVPTPAVRGGRVFLLSDLGEVECLDPETGKAVWAGALPKSGSKFYGCPLLFGDRLFALREDGAFFIVGIAGRFELLEQGLLGERAIASPVGVEGRIFVRGEKNLVCFGSR